MIKRDEEILMMARTIWAEARGESRLGRLGVGSVIKNRVDTSRRFGRSVTEVVLAPKQFSCYNRAVSIKRLLQPTRYDSKSVWEKCLAIAEDVMSGKVDDPTDGATHYCRYDCHPKWREKMIETTRIGSHVFMREA